jgi:OOP family OmpA-OmpF porin
MKLISAILIVAAMVIAMAAVPAAAGYKDQWVKFRAQMKEKPDSKALCYILMPWPGKCFCEVDSDGDGISDSKDKCPDTPSGAVVDKNGCPEDSDGDGVVDGIDRCPDTPARAKVDAKGCPIDSDKDGVYDGIDRCPNTPAGATVDAEGCPSDADNDGVFDGADRCPGTPAGAKVDSQGCPIDSDKDGIYDGIDRCPNTPAGAKVDDSGCPAEVKKFLDTGLISSTDIMFDFDKATLKPESKAALDKIGNILIQAPDLKIEIDGHTDAKGSDKYNLKLSDERAKAVHDYLERNFLQINPSNLVSKGYGESKPVASNDTDAGRAKNRRVEFKILK